MKDFPCQGVSLVIPTWNGKHLLRECLPSVVLAAERYPGETEVVVVDDGSEDGTIAFLSETFPSVRTIRLKKNEGFQEASNRGVEESAHDLVFLLNNDMILDSNCIQPLALHFEDDLLFAAGPLMLKGNSKEAVFSCCGVRLRRGLLIEEWTVVNGRDRCNRLSPSLYLSGGAMLFKKDIFRKIGMMDALYHPFYCEDLDICYRAWKMGYHLLFDPRSIVHHKGSATIGSNFPYSYYELIHRRNLFLFMWRNLTDRDVLFEHILFLLPRLLKRTFKADFMEVKSFLMALSRLPEVRKRRSKEIREYVRSDSEILNMLTLENLISNDFRFKRKSEGAVCGKEPKGQTEYDV
ncbi:glycosyltransferase family 2 protein [Candidatus Poribacteria bacterium]|nr:glycosyltransferase family 2 protein [Candidatus Poribacteria bacterium]